MNESAKLYKIYRYNPITGYWRHERTCASGLENPWLAVFYKQEPEALFRLARHCPKGKPTKRDEQVRWTMLNRYISQTAESRKGAER